MWLEEIEVDPDLTIWVAAGFVALCQYLARHAAFQQWLTTHGQED